MFKSIGNFFKSVFKFVGQVFKAIINSQIGRAIIQIAACAYALPACFAAAGALTLATGGSVVDAIKSTAFAFVSVKVWPLVGTELGGLGLDPSSAEFFVTKTAVHCVVGGALSVAQGGSFMEGFAANAVGAAGGLFTDGTAIGENIFTDTVAVATIGGRASMITGGKFLNGATTAAFANLFNKWGKEFKKFSWNSFLVSVADAVHPNSGILGVGPGGGLGWTAPLLGELGPLEAATAKLLS